MNSPVGHRKRIRHYDLPGHLHELTFSCYQRRPLLTNDRWRVMLSTSIDRACQRHRYRLASFVFMPEHVHLLVWPSDADSAVEQLLRAIKRPFSYRVKQLLQQEQHELLEQLTIQQRPGVNTFRFWQEGPGYDRNLVEPATILKAIEYIHLNPVRRGLCKLAVDWKWSSARYYYSDEYEQESDIPVISNLGADILGDSFSIRS